MLTLLESQRAMTSDATLLSPELAKVTLLATTIVIMHKPVSFECRYDHRR